MQAGLSWCRASKPAPVCVVSQRYPQDVGGRSSVPWRSRELVVWGLRWDAWKQQVHHVRRARSFVSAKVVQENSVEMASQEKTCPVTYIMVNGLTGRMGQAVAKAASGVGGLQLVPVCLSHLRGEERCVRIGDVDVEVKDPSEIERVLDCVAQDFPNVIVVDYTLPAAVNRNAEAYCKKLLPFVMGTTGGDREKLLGTVERAGSYAVIAPNMGKQVVAFQAALEIMAEQFPGAFSGFNLKVTESHQSSKVDTSGTAKAVVSSFNKSGIDFDLSQIQMVREPEKQVEMGVPVEHLNGHAFHTYTVTSSDGLATFEFKHNICGREIYAQGTVDAVLFLAKKVREKSAKKLYNMIDVLREGSMRWMCPDVMAMANM